MNVKQILEHLADKSYKNFSQKLLPNVENILGVKLPVLRKFAKEIYKKYDWQSFLSIKSTCMEETLLKGFIIGLIKDEPENILNYISDFIPQIDNWSVCDSFCSSLNFTKENQDIVWKFIIKYALSEDEFQSRFAFVMMLDYFVEEKYLTKIFHIINKFKNKKYYSQMAVAWLLSICYIKYPKETEKFLKGTMIDNFTLKKSIQKIGESNRVDRTSPEYQRIKAIR